MYKVFLDTILGSQSVYLIFEEVFLFLGSSGPWEEGQNRNSALINQGLIKCAQDCVQKSIYSVFVYCNLFYIFIVHGTGDMIFEVVWS